MAVKNTLRIEGLEGYSIEELREAIRTGARFIRFQYAISLVVITFKQNSPVSIIRPGENVLAKGWPFISLSLLLGWWGIPWGPVYTVGTIIHNLKGGEDITDKVWYTIDANPDASVSEIL